MRTHPVKKVLDGILTLLVGMRITLRSIFRGKVTEQYPSQKVVLSKAYRSCIEFVEFEATGTHDCIACGKCAQICPSRCINVEGDKPDGLKRKRATLFEVDFALCSVCGLCIDVCPTDTLKYSRKFDDASFDRKTFVYDLLEDLRPREEAYLARAREEAAQEAAAKAQAKAAAAAAAPPPPAPAAPLAATPEAPDGLAPAT
jgi:NADH-quinone oxidoreductase subunit I